MPGAESFRAPAEAYDRFVGRYSEALARALVNFAGARAGHRALDVGCGPGALAAELAARLGPRSVAAVDPSPEFVAACRARLPAIDVGEASAERLPFPDSSFDLVASQLVVNFIEDPEAGVREMVRVTRPGGTVVACVWDYAGEMTLLRSFWDAAATVAPEAAAAADEGVVMPWCGEGDIAELWRIGGLDAVEFGSLVVRAAYRDFEDLWSPLPTGIGPAGAFCRSLGADEQDALRAALQSRLGATAEPFELTARAWAARGEVPE